MWTAIGLALFVLIVIMVVGNDPKIMGRETHPKWVWFFGWLAVVVMFALGRQRGLASHNVRRSHLASHSGRVTATARRYHLRQA